ncbi:DUF533 domain-containing protein [Thalassovita aquimarina]|uniref:DUF533 domain-containing protein n=1 Tax=Thalassovita aquimarina TaxID=2785917 RepID=A0ABS5HUN8_9RHOB|nr:DUF533 domain-containing protein [Thalassovita aquimarina]MBR9652507.1 DUF533 domain-containing protein [Thalassovita aquimarina]
MSFVQTLAALTIGFAAARGVDKYRKMGGMKGVKDAMRKAGDEEGLAGTLGDMAEKMGLPGGKKAVIDMMSKFGNQAADTTEATEAGLDNMMKMMTTAAATGTGGLSELYSHLTAGTPLGAASEENARLMIRTMIQSAKADGEIDAEERKVILDHLSDASEEEIAFVEAALDAPVDVNALVQDAGTTARSQIYAAALTPITVNTEAEKAYLRQLASALQLSDEKVAEIHETMDKAPL